MKRFLFALAVIVAFVSGAVAQETVTLSTPITATTAAEHVGYVGLDLDGGRIFAQVENSANVVLVTKTYDATTTPTGATLLSAINAPGTYATSLLRRVYTRLIADGVIPAGAVTGSPQ